MYGYGGMKPSCSHLMPAKSVEALNAYGSGHYDQQVRFASVKQRPYGSRRISAKELEQLMERQGGSVSQFQPFPLNEVRFFTFPLGIQVEHFENAKKYRKSYIYILDVFRKRPAREFRIS